MTSKKRRSAAFTSLLHEVTRYNERKAEGSLHYHDAHKVEGAAIELAAAIRADDIQRALA